ncbi:hypothetical protein [Ensifer sp. Root127]|uniref:hypothetical protein n=1 Tax=Ensifer sp. Root127 TaxID=1736440 RepID=UPI00070C45B5|nr:hypothetical protein [Ensifer sp. Root127]KQW60732.1 hypothetical protein ASD03_36805 [Ensifer sp. Root127]
MSDENSSELKLPQTGVPLRARKSKTRTLKDKNAAKPASKVADGAKRKFAKYTNEDRAEKLGAISNMICSGTHNLKDALRQVGVGKQTYYIWQKAVSEAVTKPDGDLPASVPTSDNSPLSGLQDLLELEEENLKLRKILAEKLRAENTELRKRLGMG